METIKLYDENNNEKEFKIINTFGMDDDNYCLLEDISNGDNVILKYIENDEKIEFIGLRDQKELDEAIEAYEELMDSKKEQ
ncbi:DUF1292 domain-containing protein [uncultured Finegoldia sp.]|uniref:DUF1292 domain-containing protein n=1 Tax=uncultured Finegoldia sp. TaxID=328009 RepID=UPI002624FB3F|nr:DUF1292 domain-containing protein [uncultured Finegoldia sp.]